jgi:hypothetical protein
LTDNTRQLPRCTFQGHLPAKGWRAVYNAASQFQSFDVGANNFDVGVQSFDVGANSFDVGNYLPGKILLVFTLTRLSPGFQ